MSPAFSDALETLQVCCSWSADAHMVFEHYRYFFSLWTLLFLGISDAMGGYFVIVTSPTVFSDLFLNTCSKIVFMLWKCVCDLGISVTFLFSFFSLVNLSFFWRPRRNEWVIFELMVQRTPLTPWRQLVCQDLRKLVHDSRPMACAMSLLVCFFRASCCGSFLQALRLLPIF